MPNHNERARREIAAAKSALGVVKSYTASVEERLRNAEAALNDAVAAANASSAANDRATRIRRHPTEPTFNRDTMVKVHFTGDRDGNHFAVCLPTDDFKRIRVPGFTDRVSRRMWKYTYERSTGTSGVRSWGGMLRTLDGHGRRVTKIEVTTNGSTRQVYSA